jgi:DNA-binding IclR family transcriptional regulator
MKSRSSRKGARLQLGATSRSVERVIAILDYLHLTGTSVSIAELCRTLHIPRSSAYQIVRPLVAGGLIERVGLAGGIALGRRLYEFGLAYGARSRLMQVALPMVDALRDQTGETAQLTVLDREEVLVVLKAEGREPIHVATRLGLRVPVNWSAAGRLLVSDLAGPELRRRLPRLVIPSPSGKATTDIAALIAEVRAARHNGIAIQLNQSTQNIGAMAAPVFDGDGRCIAAVSVLVPAHRLQGAHRRALRAAVVTAAGKVSARLANGAGRARPQGGDGASAVAKKRDLSRR